MKKKHTENIERAIKKINRDFEGIYELELRSLDGRFYIIDSSEELYWDGFRADEVIEFLNEAVDMDFKGGYIDCVCHGRYIVDEG
jgi:hypothetical protein